MVDLTTHQKIHFVRQSAHILGVYCSNYVLLNRNFAKNRLLVDNNTKCIIKTGNKKPSKLAMFKKMILKEIH